MEFHVSVPVERLEESVPFLEREGFLPEVRMSNAGDLDLLDNDRLSRLAALLAERDWRPFTHGPFFGLDPASIDRHISDYSIEALSRGVEATARLGGSLMVMHTGYLPQFSRHGRRAWFRNWRDRVPRLLDRAANAGVAVLLENTWDDHPGILLRLAELAGDPDMRFCLDTGHVNVFSRRPVAEWWRELGDRIAALHLHDNDGRSDDHLPPGRGSFDFPALASLLNRRESLPLLDIEVDHPRAPEGKRFIEALLAGPPGAGGGPSKGA